MSELENNQGYESYHCEEEEEAGYGVHLLLLGNLITCAGMLWVD